MIQLTEEEKLALHDMYISMHKNMYTIPKADVNAMTKTNELDCEPGESRTYNRKAPVNFHE